MFKDDSILKQLTAMARTLELSDSRIFFRGREYTSSDQTRISDLTNLLYTDCYAMKETFQAGRKNIPGVHTADISFLQQLSGHNYGRERAEQGWTIKQLFASGYAEISRNQLIKTVPLSFILQQNPAAGQQVNVYFPREEKSEAPGFYYIFSDQHIDRAQPLVRIYWNINTSGAAPLIDWISRHLNHYRIPFIFKCLNHPDLYVRRDAAVLYGEENSCDLIRKLLPECCRAVRGHLQNDVPLFAFKYQDGVGLAESPGVYESFGMHRMRLVAEAAVHNHEHTPDGLIRQVEQIFTDHGIDPEKPFLNKGSQTLPIC